MVFFIYTSIWLINYDEIGNKMLSNLRVYFVPDELENWVKEVIYHQMDNAFCIAN